MSHHDELPSIDPAALNDVTGGVTSTATSSTNAQLTSALQGITSQIASLGQNNNSSNSLQSMLPLMMLLGKGAASGACPCGCGMANCIRR